MNVLFLGPDGSGKSTIIGSLKPLLGESCTVLYLGMGDAGWLLPGMHRAHRLLTSSASHALRLHWVYWYMLLPLELLCRRAVARLKGRKRFVLIDRFPGQPFLAGGALAQLYRLVLPAPDIVVTLVGDPAIISARKPEETTCDRTRKEIEKWRSVAQRIGARRELSVDTTVRDAAGCARTVADFIASYGRKPDSRGHLRGEAPHQA